MKINLALTTFFISTFTLADPVYYLKYLEDPGLLDFFGGVRNSCVMYPQQKSINTLGSECAEILCGEQNKSLNSVLQTATEEAKKYSKVFDNKYGDGIGKYFKKAVSAHVESINDARKNIEAFGWGDESIPDYRVSKIFDNFFSFNLNLDSENIEDRVEIRYDFPENMDELIKEGVKDYAENYKKGYIRTLNVMTEEEIFNDLNEIYSAEKVIGDKTEFEKLKKKFDSLQQLSKESSDYRNGLYDIWDYSKDILNYNIPEVDCSEKCQEAVRKYANKDYFNGVIKDLLKINKDEVVEDLYNECKSMYILNQLERSRAVDAKKVLSRQVKKMANTAISSENSQDKFLNFFNEEVKSNLDNDGIGGNLDELEQRLETIISTPAASYLGNYTDLMGFVTNSGKADVRERVYSCNQESHYFFLGDGSSYTPVKNDLGKYSLNVSPFAVYNPKYLNFVAAHELGHLLSHVFNLRKLSDESYRGFLEKRKCITGNLKTSNISLSKYFKHESDKTFTEEDMADYLAIKLIDDVSSENSDNKQIINTCYLIDDENESYNLSINDPHAPTIVRVIMEAKYKEIILPQQCNDYINRTQNIYGYKKCE